MEQSIFAGLFDGAGVTTVSVTDFLLCVAASLVGGVILALAFSFRTRTGKSFFLTLSLLPAVVCVVIMMVNGNVGTGVAVAGAFSLVRFRSVPGSGKEITALFIAMASGLVAGMGYLSYSLLFSVLMALLLFFGSLVLSSRKLGREGYKSLRITVPEDLNPSGVFDDILEKFTSSYELVRIKSTNLGSMFRLHYEIRMKDSSRFKEMLDEIRCRNGNLEVMLSEIEGEKTEL